MVFSEVVLFLRNASERLEEEDFFSKVEARVSAMSFDEEISPSITYIKL